MIVQLETKDSNIKEYLTTQGMGGENHITALNGRTIRRNSNRKNGKKQLTPFKSFFYQQVYNAGK